SCLVKPGSVAGGGAIELVAEKGQITIDAAITASAQTDNSKSCSGGSGGLIRLKARKVVILDNGRLIVDGAEGRRSSNSRYKRLGGGAGGIIQIIASEGSIAAGTLSIKHGASSVSPGSSCLDAEKGYFLLKENETANAVANVDLTKSYSWPPRSSNSEATATTTSLATPTEAFSTTKPSYASSTMIPLQSSVPPQNSPPPVPEIKEQLSLLMKDIQFIKNSLEQSGEVNKSAIREVLATHRSLASIATLNNDIMDLCLETFKGYLDIMALVANKEDPNFVEKTLQGILEVASNCLDEKSQAFWKKSREMPNLIQTLEDIFVAMTQGNFSSQINYTLWTKKAVAVVVRKSMTADIEDIRIPDFSDIKGSSWNDVSDFVLIPKETVQNAKGNYTYIFLLYKDVENGLPNNATSGSEENWNVSSFVMSCILKLDDKPVYDLSPPALLTFKTSSADDRERQCSFWNNKHGVWSTDGVQELKPNSSSTQTVCQTDHFTSFAILMQHRKIPLSKEDSLALSIITYIGCGVSTAALIITLIIFLSIESLSSERHKIHTNLVVSLLLAHVLFLAGIQETSSKVLCKVIAAFLHYFFLTAFTWMLVEGLHLYLKVVQVFRTENVKMVYYYVFGWCFSVIPVIITLAMKPDSYGNNEVCWLSTEDGTVWAFIGPVIAIIAINCFVLAMVVKTVVTSASAVKNSDHDHVKAGIKGLFVLMPILGVGWILGLFALNEGTIVFVYAFAIINGFQGLLIFLLHCVFNSEVRQAFRRQREKHALSRENDSQYNASFSLSHSDSGSKQMSNSNSFEKLKARISFKRKSSAKVVQVQPLNDSRDVTESSLQVKRAFQDKSPSKLCVTDIRKEISSLNCPMENEGRVPPKDTHIMSQTTNKRKKSRP
ncbi:hypothetical protein OS493_001680, partial [Desmophyllum pertusum]